MKRVPKFLLILGFISFVLLGLFTGCPDEVEPPKEVVKSVSITTDLTDVSALDNDAEVEVTLATETEGASIYYTLDGSAPTAESTKYTAVFTVKAEDPAGKTVVVKAIGIKDGFDNSGVNSKDIVFKEDAEALADVAIAAALDDVGDVELAFGTEVTAANIILELPVVEGIEYEAKLKDGNTWTVTVSDTAGKGTPQAKDIEVTVGEDPAIAAAVAAINEVDDVANMGQALADNADVLGLDLEDYNALADKDPVHTAMFGKDFGDKAALVSAFEAAVSAQKAAEAAAAAVATAKSNLDLGDISAVTDDLTLPSTQDDATLSWASSDTDVISNDGVVTRPAKGEADASVTLTATLTVGSASDTKAFVVTVKALELTDEDKVGADKVLIEAGTYEIPLANQDDQAAKTAWVQGAVNALIENGTVATVIWNGSEDKYDVGLKLNDVTGSADITVTEEALIYNQSKSKGYDTIQAAVEDAATGNTIILNADVSIGLTDSSVEVKDAKKLTLDLNGNKINSRIKKTILVNNSGELTVKDSSPGSLGKIITSEDIMFMVEGGTLIIESGTYNSTSTWSEGKYGGEFINVKGSTYEDAENYSVVKILEDATLVYTGPATESGGYGVNIGSISESAYGVNVEINGTIRTGGSVPGSGASLYINGTVKKTTGNVPKIDVGSTAVLDGLVYAAGYGEWTIANGAEFVGLMALSIKSGKFTINGGSFKAIGYYADPADANNNGTEDTGAAISITSNDGYVGEIEITIGGGTFTSVYGHALYEGIAMDNSTPAATGTKVKKIIINAGTFTGGVGGVDDIYITNQPSEKLTIDSNVVAPKQHLP